MLKISFCGFRLIIIYWIESFFSKTIRDWNKLLDFVRPAPGVHIVRIKGQRGANTAKMSGGGGEGWWEVSVVSLFLLFPFLFYRCPLRAPLSTIWSPFVVAPNQIACKFFTCWVADVPPRETSQRRRARRNGCFRRLPIGHWFFPLLSSNNPRSHCKT